MAGIALSYFDLRSADWTCGRLFDLQSAYVFRFFIRYRRLVLIASSGFTRGEYHVVRGDFIAPRGGGHRDRRRDLRIPSPISPTPLNLFPGHRCGGLIGLPRVYANLGFRYPVLSLVTTLPWGLGALCLGLYRLRFRRFCWVLGRSFFIGGGKRVRSCGCGRFLLWIFVGFALDLRAMCGAGCLWCGFIGRGGRGIWWSRLLPPARLCRFWLPLPRPFPAPAGCGGGGG